MKIMKILQIMDFLKIHHMQAKASKNMKKHEKNDITYSDTEKHENHGEPQKY